MRLPLLLAGGFVLAVAFMAAAAGSAASNIPTRERALNTVIIVYKTHFDIGYTASAKEARQSSISLLFLDGCAAAFDPRFFDAFGSAEYEQKHDP